MDIAAQKALERALRSLAIRAHSEQEIVDKLVRAGYEEEDIAEAMAKLAEYKLVDDEAFAVQWAASRARKGMGPRRIAQELYHKGISRDTADAAIGNLDADDEVEAAAKLALKHLRKGDERAKRRAYDAVIRRGFGYDTARNALARAALILAEEDSEA